MMHEPGCAASALPLQGHHEPPVSGVCASTRCSDEEVLLRVRRLGLKRRGWRYVKMLTNGGTMVFCVGKLVAIS